MIIQLILMVIKQLKEVIVMQMVNQELLHIKQITFMILNLVHIH